MKQLQNNFTTPEQSKRLLELGVPEDSADMMYYPEFTENLYSIGNGGFRMSNTPRVLMACEKFSNSTRYDSGKFRELCAPCWSVGRLIEIYNMCVDFDLDDGAAIVIFIQDEAPIVQMMQMFEDKVGIMAFSNLEE